MKKYLFAIGMSALAFTACDNSPKFVVEGTISNAADSTLYLEADGLSGIETIDSVKLGSNGNFSFKGAPSDNPEFYHIRLGNNIISFCVDSTETIKIKADAKQMAGNYEIEGNNDVAEIKEIALKQLKLKENIIKLQDNKNIAPGIAEDSIKAMVESFKNDIKYNYIFKAPNKPASYFALFQTLGNYLLFDPMTNKDDIKCFAAVATSWDAAYPEAERTKNLHNIAIRGMNNTRAPQRKTLEIDPSKVSEAGCINISLKDVNGKVRDLTSLKGQTVLLEFTVFGATQSAQRNMMLRELYNKYHSKGFTIYQVSLDEDEHFWKTSADALPWVCVRDERGLSSSYANIYGVSTVPCIFLINKDNEIKMRNEQIKDLDAAIQSLL